jgi:hypothetical protein
VAVWVGVHNGEEEVWMSGGWSGCVVKWLDGYTVWWERGAGSLLRDQTVDILRCGNIKLVLGQPELTFMDAYFWNAWSRALFW